ncbi:MAG: outer membrane lipoprotein carrier protein LolA, partial [Armatimonadota bacterium]
MRTAKRLVPALALLLLVAFLVQRYLVHPDPGRILERTVELYSGLEFYSDTTTLRSDLDSVQGTYEFAYARPNRLRVRFRGVLNDELVVADGTTLYVYRPELNQYVAAPAPRVLADELPGPQP